MTAELNLNTTENFAGSRDGKLTTPAVGATTTVTLPGEIIRADVVSITDNDHIVCKLHQPMSKAHTYHKDELVKFRRAKGLVREYWEADA